MKTQYLSKMETNQTKKFTKSKTVKAFVSVKQKVAGALILSFVLLATLSANAQSFIRFSLVQNWITVPAGIGFTNSTVITNLVNLSGGCTNANFNVSGLPPGAGAALTDTNGNPRLSITDDTNLWLTVNTTNIPQGLYNFRLNAGGFDTNGLPVTNSIIFVLQAAHIWNGSMNVSNGWSDASSWLGGAPGPLDDVVFTDIGAQTNAFAGTTGQIFTNSFVTANTTIGSLRFAQPGVTNTIATNPPPYYHHVQIAPATTLTIAGTNGFRLMWDFFNFEQGNVGTLMGVTIDGGVGSRLVVSNQNANVSLLTGGNGSAIPTLNMSNLDNTVFKVNRVGFGDFRLYPNYRDFNNGLNVGRDTNQYSGRPRRMIANVYWAKTNLITTSYRNPDNYTNEFTREYAFTLFNNEQSAVGGAGGSQLLGISNIFFVDSICFYHSGGNGTTKFGYTNGVAIFRNTNGTRRLSVFTGADSGGTNELETSTKGIVDFSGNNGLVDILATNLYLSRDREQISTNSTPNIQADLTIGRGIVDVNTAILGFQEHTKPDWTVIGGGQPYLNYCQGRLFVTNGGTFRVTGTMTLGYTADTNDSANAQQYGTYGQITIYSNSVVTASNIVVDGGLNFYDPSLSLPGATPRANYITINQGGNLVVSNSIGANNYSSSSYPTFSNPGGPGMPLDRLTMGQGSTLTLFATAGKTNVYVRNFLSTGVTPGTIKIASLAGVTIYPTNIPLIAYSSPTAPSLQADMSAVGGNVQGYIINDAVAQTINLFVTTNAPKTLTWKGGTDNNWDLTTPNWVITGSSTVTNFAMGDIVNFDDSSVVTNITIVEVVVPNQATNGMVITNSARQYTFSQVSVGQIAGTAKILKQGTNLVTFNAPESGPLSVTAGEVDVSSSGILGTTTLYSNAVLQVLSGGIGGSLTSTGVVMVASGGAISGTVSLQGGYLVNNGAINTPGANNSLVINNAVMTNNSGATIALPNNGNPAAQVFTGSTLANFGDITTAGGVLVVDGLYFGTGSFRDTVNQATSANVGRLQLDSVPSAVISPGATPNNSIGNLFINGRLDLHASNPNNNAGTFLIELNSGGTVYDNLQVARWNNIGCIWAMTNLDNSPFSLGQSFQILQNINGLNLSNIVDNPSLFPLMSPTVPGPGLQWNLSGVQVFGIVSITNSTMVWDGNGSATWDTNSSPSNWKSGNVYGNNQGAIFDDRASGSTTISLTTPVSPAGFNVVTVTNIDIVLNVTNIVTTTNAPTFSPGIVVSNALKNYTFTASNSTNRITGMTSIYKTGSGTLTLLTANDFIGGVVIEGGTVAVTNTAAWGIAPTTQKPAYNQVVIDNATVKWFGGATNSNFGRFITVKQNGATFEVASNFAALNLSSPVLGSGALTKTGPGILLLSQTGDAYAGGTTVNAGTLLLSGAAAGPGGITLANSTVLALTNATSGVGISFTNAINVTGVGTAINVLGISTNVSGGACAGSGTTTVTITIPPSLFVFNAAISHYSGTISFGTSSNVFQFNNATNRNQCLGSATAAFDLGTGAAKLNNLNGSNLVYNLGSLAGGPNTVLTGRASTNSADFNGETYSIGGNSIDSIFSGKITNGLPSNGVGSDPVSRVKVGPAKLFQNGVSSDTGSTPVSSGVLGGTGSIASPLTVVAGGTLSPGISIGTFTVSNNVTLGGTTVMELNPSGSDLLRVTGAIANTGSLVVTNIGGTLFNGTVFTLFSQPVSGFSNIQLPAGYTWTTNLAVNGSITVVSGGITINTNSTNIVTSVSGGTNLNLSWPTDHIGWSLQVQTNPLFIGLSSNWFIVPGSTTTNNMSFPIVPTNGSVFYRLTY